MGLHDRGNNPPQSKYPLPISAAALGFATWAHVLLSQPTATFSPSSREEGEMVLNVKCIGREGRGRSSDDDSGLVVCEGVGPLRSLSASLRSLPTPPTRLYQLKWMSHIPLSTPI